MSRLHFKDYYYVGVQSVLFILFIGLQVQPYPLFPEVNIQDPAPCRFGIGRYRGLVYSCRSIAIE